MVVVAVAAAAVVVVAETLEVEGTKIQMQNNSESCSLAASAMKLMNPAFVLTLNSGAKLLIVLSCEIQTPKGIQNTAIHSS